MRHLPYEKRLQRLGLHSLHRRRLCADLITAFKIFTGLLVIDSDLLCLHPTRRDLRGHSYKVHQCTSHRRSRGRPFRWGLWNAGISSRLPYLGRSLDRSLSPFPPLTEHSSPQFHNTLPRPTWTSPIISYHLFMLPNVMLLNVLSMWCIHSHWGLLLPL